MKNGDLLRAAEEAGYDALLTVDQGFPYQQQTGDRGIAIVILRAATNQIEDLLPLTRAISDVVRQIKPGEVVTIDANR